MPKRRKKRRRSRNALLVQHLEKVSWKVLDHYPDVVKGLIRGQAGVYALYKKERIAYVGLASNLMGRIKSHLKDRHRGAWDRFSVYLTGTTDHMKELESLLIRIVAPVGNRAGGRLPRSLTLSGPLNRGMKEADADRRAQIIGGWVARRRTRTKTRRGGDAALAGVYERSGPLRAKYKGELIRATLRRNGMIRVGKKTFLSPSAAARHVVGRAKNGWDFWHYRSGRRWVPLSKLRR